LPIIPISALLMRPLPFHFLRDERGFTLPEVLVVTIVVGLLAAIALPQMINQTRRADDATAKADATNLSLQIETCNVEAHDFRQCDSQAEIVAASGAIGATWGTGPGEVSVTDSASGTYTVVGHSTTGARFTLVMLDTGSRDRSCTPKGHGGCPGDGNW
jgi:prepilin-type N-terminal cleavage/methylation domain-containing protein